MIKVCPTTSPPVPLTSSPQLIIFYKEVFEREGLDLWLKPYSILSTAKTTGLIEVRAGQPDAYLSWCIGKWHLRYVGCAYVAEVLHVSIYSKGSVQSVYRVALACCTPCLGVWGVMTRRV